MEKTVFSRRIAYELRKQGKVFDDYVMVARVTLEQIKAVLNGQPIVFDDDVFDEREKDSLIEPDAIIVDVNDISEKEADTNTKEEIKTEVKMPKDHISLIMEEMEAGVLDQDFLQLMLDLHLNNVDKIFYAGGIQ